MKYNLTYGLIAAGLVLSLSLNAMKMPIHTEVEDDNLKRVKTLVQKDSTVVNLKDMDGQTALHIASKRGPTGGTPIVKFLLEEGTANVNAQDNEGKTALHNAISTNDTWTTAALVTSDKIDVNIQDNRGQTPIMTAAYPNFRAKLIKQLLESGKAVNLNLADSSGNTVLHRLVKAMSTTEGYAKKFDWPETEVDETLKKFAETAKLLIAKGAQKNAKNKAGRTPVELAKKDTETKKKLKGLF